MYEQILFERRGPVTLITINRPERMNAIGPVVSRELIDAWGQFRDDDDQLVAVLTGAGSDAFCAGADLKAAMAATQPDSDEEPLINWTPEEIEAHNRGERDGIRLRRKDPVKLGSGQFCPRLAPEKIRREKDRSPIFRS